MGGERHARTQTLILESVGLRYQKKGSLEAASLRKLIKRTDQADAFLVPDVRAKRARNFSTRPVSTIRV